jgi:hypothetical protein
MKEGKKEGRKRKKAIKFALSLPFLPANFC